MEVHVNVIMYRGDSILSLMWLCMYGGIPFCSSAPNGLKHLMGQGGVVRLEVNYPTNECVHDV